MIQIRNCCTLKVRQFYWFEICHLKTKFYLQPKPAKRGSGQISMKDIDKIDSLTQQIKDLRKDTSTSEQSTNSKDTVDQLTKDIEKLRKHTLQTEEKDQDK